MWTESLLAMLAQLADDAAADAERHATSAEFHAREAAAERALRDRAVARVERFRAMRVALEHVPADVSTWRERIWHVPPDAELSVAEAAEALGWSRFRVYRNITHREREIAGRLLRSGDVPLPHERRGNVPEPGRRDTRQIVFRAGTLRSFMAQMSIVMQDGTAESAAVPIVREMRRRRRGRVRRTHAD